ncbi:MAG: YkgJ family cysteine cluster protein [Desulfobacterales bacterium]|nr:YkgJ family cysteine cluster protein [Desulfobacterales bacterium]
MRYVSMEDIDELPGQRLEDGDVFFFRCHPDVSCFNRCCRNLNLFLYPYDVIRLRERLGVSSDEFIDHYVDVVLRPDACFPEVLLRMSENEERTCPFLSEAGCTVYPDRPDACRTFPVEMGQLFDAREKKIRPIRFFRPPDFCMGIHEKMEWTPKTWAKDQDAVEYNRMTILWSEIKGLFQTDPWGAEGPKGPRARMAFMAAYNIDKFREFVFGSSFLKRYKVKAPILKKIKAGNDVELMKIGFSWLKLSIWGKSSKNLKPRK